MECGTTTDGCNGKAGTFKIEYQLSTSPSIKYRFGSGAWVEVKGATRYEVTQEQQSGSFPGGQCANKSYRVVTTATCGTNSGQFKCGLAINLFSDFAFAGSVQKITPTLIHGQTIQVTVEYIANNQLRTITSMMSVAIPPAISGASFRATFSNTPVCVSSSQGMRAYNVGSFAPRRTDNTTVEQDIAECGSKESGNYKLKIFDCTNRLLAEVSGAGVPEVLTIPSTIEGEKKSFLIANKDANKLLSVFNISNNGINSTLVKLGEVTIKQIDSPLCGIAPSVCWDCDEDKKCPENTCSVDCKGHICCVDKNGNIVKTIKK
jgi:hypothetical protein